MSEADALGTTVQGLSDSDRNALPSKPKPKKTEILERWSSIAHDASVLDHTPLKPGEARVFGEQLGQRASRATAIVHIAMFDAMNIAVGGCYKNYTNVTAATTAKASPQAAIAQAAHDTLIKMYPSQVASFDAALAEDLASIPNLERRARGVDLGQRAAAAILAMRTGDGAEVPEPRIGVDYIPSPDAGAWRPDPISQVKIALGGRWDDVAPFSIKSADQFRADPPPALTSNAYTTAYNEVKSLGGNGTPTGTPTARTPDQTVAGIFWSYDGSPGVGVTTRLFNQITIALARQRDVKNLEFARLLALANVAMADAAIGVFESKYLYRFWRPITAIRESDAGTGPTGSGDGNPNTVGDPTFTPLGAPATNLPRPGFTPPHPSYPSQHASVGSAMFETLRNYFGTDNISFTLVSDEYNGVNRGSDGVVRPLAPRSFSTLSQAEIENGKSRVYLGIHWDFDLTAGYKMGRKIGNYVYRNALAPVKGCAKKSDAEIAAAVADSSTAQ